MKKTTFAILLPLLSASAMAQTAFQQLKLQAGDDAVAASARVLPVQASALPLIAPSVTPETAEKIQTSFRALKGKNFPGVEWRGMPLGVRYVRVPLELTSCLGCASYTALLPVGVLYPGAPASDPNKAGYFILEKTVEGKNPRALYSEPIRMPAKDVFAGCQAVDAKTMLAWTLPQAVGLMQSCLDKTYNQNPNSRRIYFVAAQAARFGVRACPATTGAFSCQAIIEVQGVQIKVSGRHMSDDTVADDLSYAVEKRGGKLLGFHAVLSDESEILHPEL